MMSFSKPAAGLTFSNVACSSSGNVRSSRSKRKLSITETGDGKRQKSMDEGEVCSYCMQEMKAEHDPRKLPCGHIFCLGCLKDNFESSELTIHQCATCGAASDTDFDSLLAMEISEKSSDEKESTVLFCDRCQKKAAVRYCIDCGVKSCAQHMEHHEGWYNGIHETVDIMEYAQNRSQYNKAIICEHHKKCITMTCKNCYHYNCRQCCEKKTFCQARGYGTDHIYCSLAEVEKETREKFKQLLQTASNKLTEIAEADKDAWENHEVLVEECEKMLAEVERKSKEQIEDIKAQTEQLKKAIQDYKEEGVEKVFTFCNDLITKTDQIEEARKSTHSFLRDVNVSELLEGAQERVDLLNSVNDIHWNKPHWDDKKLRKGKKQKMEIELTVGGQDTCTSRYYPVSSERPFFASYNRWRN